MTYINEVISAFNLLKAILPLVIIRTFPSSYPSLSPPCLKLVWWKSEKCLLMLMSQHIYVQSPSRAVSSGQIVSRQDTRREGWCSALIDLLRRNSLGMVPPSEVKRTSLDSVLHCPPLTSPPSLRRLDLRRFAASCFRFADLFISLPRANLDHFGLV